MTTYILNESGEWIEGEPTENGQRYKVVYTDGGSIESVYSVPVVPTEITITGITGALFHADDFSKATCMVNDVVTITGTVDVPDTTFAMPLKYGNNYEMFAVPVVDGAFTAKVYFEQSDQYIYSNAEANKDMYPNTFTVQTILIDVLKTPVQE